MNNKPETELSFPFPLFCLQVFVDGYITHKTKSVFVDGWTSAIVGSGGYFPNRVGIQAIDQP